MSRGAPVYETERNPFSVRLRELMKETKTTQRALADFVGVRPQTISLYCQGQSFPDVNGVAKVAEYFRVSTDYLVGNSAAAVPDVNVQGISNFTGLSDDSIFFLEGLKNDGGERGRRALSAISLLLSEKNGDACLDYWERLALFLFSSQKPFAALLETGERTFEATAVLSILLEENNLLLRKLRDENIKKEG